MHQYPYADIIHLSRPQSNRPKMAEEDRAAQFSPFSALTGYEAAIDETARLTESRIELDEEAKTALDRQLTALLTAEKAPRVTLTYFQPDDRKEGGAYREITGYVRRVDTTTRTVFLAEGTTIPLDSLYKITEEN